MNGNDAKTWSGTLHYLTGGTTRTPRIIAYDSARWRRSVQVTADVLSSHGVCNSSRVIVCQPFAPWAIGPVFSEAALMCGACVYPMGLYASHLNFQKLIKSIMPTHMCATARNLIRWMLSMQRAGIELERGPRRTAFVAGEPLTNTTRQHCRELWNADVVNVYGMAEFDTIAAELPGHAELALAPYFDYRIRHDSREQVLEPGFEGQLLIHDEDGGRWFETRDKVRVVGRVEDSASIWHGVPLIEILGREDDSVMLSDGTCIGPHQVAEIHSASPEIERIQIHVTHTAEGDRVQLLYVTSSCYAIVEQRVIESFIGSSIDIEDSYKHGVICNVSARCVAEDELAKTPRGKFPVFVEVDQYGSVEEVCIT